jgi:ATP-dependent helicase/nuclease subunit B
MDRPEARALWWPRFLRIAAWFAGWEAERRINIITIDAEIKGDISIALDNDRSFTLTARADRIEHRTDNTFAILDYKTGAPPSSKQVRLGLSPQLTLEAAILRAGGFKPIAPGASVSELMYVRLSGNNPAGQSIPVELNASKNDDQSPDKAADHARTKLEELIKIFDNEEQPYKSLVLPMWSYEYGSYDDLARIKEWSAGGHGDDIE